MSELTNLRVELDETLDKAERFDVQVRYIEALEVEVARLNESLAVSRRREAPSGERHGYPWD